MECAQRIDRIIASVRYCSQSRRSPLLLRRDHHSYPTQDRNQRPRIWRGRRPHHGVSEYGEADGEEGEAGAHGGGEQGEGAAVVGAGGGDEQRRHDQHRDGADMPGEMVQPDDVERQAAIGEWAEDFWRAEQLVRGGAKKAKQRAQVEHESGQTHIRDPVQFRAAA